MMGRIYFNAKSTVETELQLNIFKLNQRNLLRNGSQGALRWTRSISKTESNVGFVVEMGDTPNIQLLYTTTKSNGETIDSDYLIWLTTSSCNYGGKRFWFCCPFCGRRVGTLYLTGRYDKFICRGCSNLSYQSRNESRSYRNNALFFLVDHHGKIQRQYKKMKRWQYAGCPTKKAMKLYRMESIFLDVHARWKKAKAANQRIL